MSGPGADAVHFYGSPRGLWRSIILFGLIAAIGVPMLMDPASVPLGLLWIAGFAGPVVPLARRLSDRAPVVTIDSAGILDRRIKATPLTWDTISAAGDLEAEGVPFVGLRLNDPEAVLGDAAAVVRLAHPLHRFLGWPDVTFQMSLLDGGDTELLSAIRRFRPDLVAHH